MYCCDKAREGVCGCLEGGGRKLTLLYVDAGDVAALPVMYRGGVGDMRDEEPMLMMRVG